MKATYEKHIFQFKRPSGTSRGVLTEKIAWILRLEENGKVGIGECSIIPGLSPDFSSEKDHVAQLNKVKNDLETAILTEENCAKKLQEFPSILFGVETAFKNLHLGGSNYFSNAFTRGEQKISINGLIWMGDIAFMQEQIKEKIEAGFTTIKLKIGAIDFEKEYKILEQIRAKYSAAEITLRVDANGAFSPMEAKQKLEQLASFDLHSIEQPIAAGQWGTMAKLCADTPLPIALDEELIGVHEAKQKAALLDSIQPQFIILKPSLHGGISGAQEWIQLAEERSILWWLTSALESNVGLQAICQFAAEYDNSLPQGLGTGSLYTNNIASDLVVENGRIGRKLR